MLCAARRHRFGFISSIRYYCNVEYWMLHARQTPHTLIPPPPTLDTPKYCFVWIWMLPFMFFSYSFSCRIMFIQSKLPFHKHTNTHTHTRPSSPVVVRLFTHTQTHCQQFYHHRKYFTSCQMNIPTINVSCAHKTHKEPPSLKPTIPRSPSHLILWLHPFRQRTNE